MNRKIMNLGIISVSTIYLNKDPECRLAWLSHRVWNADIVGSNPTTQKYICL